MTRFRRWSLSVLTMVSVASVVLVTGWGSALASSAPARMALAHETARPSTPHVGGPRSTTNQSPRYRFSSHEQGVRAATIRFRCAVDSTSLRPCPRVYQAQLSIGSHILAVQAVDRRGRKSRVAHVRITVTKPTPPGAEVVATINMPAAAFQRIAADASAVWVQTPDHVVRGDPASNTIAAQISTPSIPNDDGYIASGAGAVWETDFLGESLRRIDPSTNTVVATIDLGSAPEGVAMAGGAVWVAEHEDGTVVRIDPATNAIVATITVGPPGSSGPLEMAAGPTGIWVNVPNETRVVHIDPSTNSVVGFVDEEGQPIVDGTSVWVETGGGLDRIDSATAKIVAHIATPPGNAWGTAGLGSVWMTTYQGLVRVDEASNQIVGVLPNVPKGDLAVTAGSVWLAGNGTLLRLQPVG